MTYSKKITFLLIYFFFIVILSLLIFELGLRILGGSKLWSETRDLNVVTEFEYEYDISRLYKDDKKKITYIRNEFGLRDNCEDPSKIDILTMGGSTTDQRYVSFNSTFQKVLQDKLSEKLTKDICISNAGVDGHSTHGHIESFNKWFPLIPGLKPKFVLLYIGLNDTHHFDKSGKARGFDNSPNSLSNLIRKTYIYKYLIPFYRYFQQKLTSAKGIGHLNAGYKDKDYSIEHLNEDSIRKSDNLIKIFRKNLRTLLGQISELGSLPICVTQPHDFSRIINGKKLGLTEIRDNLSGLDYDFILRRVNKEITEICGEENTIDIYSKKFKKEFFYDGVHTTNKGSVFLGNILFNELISKQKIIDKLNN